FIRMLQAFCRTVDDSSAGRLVCMFATDLGVQGMAESDSVMDPVTGLMGMRPFLNVMNAYRNEHNASGAAGNLAVLYYNIVNFRLINLNYGMAIGDDFLRNMGRILRDLFPEYAIAHFDADHFVVLCDQDDAESRAAESKSRITSIISNFPIDIRVGACIWYDPMQKAESVCNEAKLACDSSRAGLTTWFCWYTEDIGKRLAIQEYVVSHINEAVDKGWIQVYYQPIVRVISGQVCGFEALARWLDPIYGMLSPEEFIGPLEDAHCVTTLDLYMIDSVCRHHEELFKEGRQVVPVSVNLSRLDFASCDIFSEIEKILQKYNVPRHLLHLEITESVLASDEGNIKKTLDKFRSVGYEIMMDDFGSAYSTLNMLKDYKFDVLKIDMAFLKKDTKRSRSIISSIISMDKKIVNVTLAEGVETEEQFEFLKESGCDTVQGYYFGKPMPQNESIASCLQRGMGIETVEWKPYYDALSRIDFTTDVPMAIFEFSHGRFHHLFMNDKFSDLTKQMGSKNNEETESFLNSRNNASSRELRLIAEKAMKSGKSGTYFFESSTMEMQLRYRVISSLNERTMFLVEMANVSRERESMKERDWLLQNIRYLYDELFIINLDRQTVVSVMETGPDEDETPTRFANDSEEMYKFLPDIFPADRDRYKAYIDPDTILDRVRNSRSGIIAGCFRTGEDRGNFAWKSHRIFLVPHEKDRILLYAVRSMDMSYAEQDLEEVRKDPYTLLTEDPKNGEEVLWEDLIMQCPIPMFWKDSDRKFLGVSQSFLKYYGYKDEEPLLGKTDEDMHWHPDNEPYRQDELDVINNGNRHTLVPGKCIAKGVTHDILATKWPVYRDGVIQGLMGFFLDENMVMRITGKRVEASNLDPVTGLENLHGILNDFSLYMEDFRNHGTHFAAILVTIPSLSREIETYGTKHGNAILKACADEIADIIHNRGSAARFSADQFAILSKYQNPEEIVRSAARIRTSLENIHNVGREKCTVFTRTHILYAEDTPEFEDQLFHSIMEGKYAGRKDVLVPDFGTRSSMLRSFFDEMPLGVCIVRRDTRIDYWNSKAEEITGYSAEDMVGNICVNTPLLELHDNGMPMCTSNCPLQRVIKSNAPYVRHAYIITKQGKRILVRSTYSPLRDKSGHLHEIAWFIERETAADFGDTIIQSIYEMATKDPVTGLPGRKYLESYLTGKIEEYQRTGAMFAVLFADIDDFHAFNNLYGHDVGDRILRAFGEALSKNVRRTDCWGRWGGDEFVAIFAVRDKDDMEK
ncbi:MAG: EAL domain-containing protein, partial [Anaerovoracaceae bacterium]